MIVSVWQFHNPIVISIASQKQFRGRALNYMVTPLFRFLQLSQAIFILMHCWYMVWIHLILTVCCMGQGMVQYLHNVCGHWWWVWIQVERDVTRVWCPACLGDKISAAQLPGCSENVTSSSSWAKLFSRLSQELTGDHIYIIRLICRTSI